MDQLQKLMTGFLQSADYRIIEERPEFLVADRLDVGDVRDTRVVWIVPTPINLDSYRDIERRLLNDFKRQTDRFPGGKYLLLCHTLEGFSREFRRNARDLRVQINVPVNVFDSPFRVEESEEAISPLKQLRDPSEGKTRVRQPFEVLRGEEVIHKGEDLLTYFRKELEDSSNQCLRIIVAPAGGGKSVLFRTLFLVLYEEFKRKKNARQLYPRPIPFMPEYRKQALAPRIGALVDAFLKTDVASPVRRESFEWMLSHRFLMWMFDGLDELYAGDPEFFDYLLDMLTREESKAQILICARESLLTSCDAFAEFLRGYAGAGSDAIRVYRLLEWEDAPKREFAWIQLTGKVPQPGTVDPPRVIQFLNALKSSASLTALSKLPYYCGLLLDRFQEGQLGEFANEFALVEKSVDWIIDREFKKGLISPQRFEGDGLREWLEAIAAEYLESGFSGVSKSEVEEYAGLVLVPDISEQEAKDTTTTLVQFPVFAPGSEPGFIAFKHEIVAELLAARYLVRRLRTDPEWVGRTIGNRIDLANSFLLRYMAKSLPQQVGAVLSLQSALRYGNLPERSFANLLQLYLLVSPSRDCIQELKLSFENRDLMHVQFVDKNLRSVFFTNADLENAVFRGCDLGEAHFEGAGLVGTRFDKAGASSLAGAHFGSLERFSYVFYEGQKIEDLNRAIEWVKKVTGRQEEIHPACPTSLQLRALFMKYIHPDGSGRRDELNTNALHSGRRYPGAPGIDSLIDACQRYGYLTPTNRPDRFKRAPGEKYHQMVLFVKDWSLSIELKQLLDSFCRQHNCSHVPAKRR